MTHTIIYQFSCQLRPHSNPFFSECNLISNFIIVHWYFVFKIVLAYCEKKNVLVIEKKHLKLEAEGREFANIFQISRTISLNSETSDEFLKQNLFLEVSHI